MFAASPSTIVASAILAVSTATGSRPSFGAISPQASSYAVKITFKSSGPNEAGRAVWRDSMTPSPDPELQPYQWLKGVETSIRGNPERAGGKADGKGRPSLSHVRA